jgi:hypothetical protein
MGMSTRVVGFQPADERWKQMKLIWDTCEAAGLIAPNAVYEFFGDEPPGDKPGRVVDLEAVLVPWRDEGSEGFQLEVSQIPPNVKVIRFYNSW